MTVAMSGVGGDAGEGGDADLHALLQQVELSPFKPTQSSGRRQFRRSLVAAQAEEEAEAGDKAEAGEEGDEGDDADKENVHVNVQGVARSTSAAAHPKGRSQRPQRKAPAVIDADDEVERVTEAELERKYDEVEEEGHSEEAQTGDAEGEEGDEEAPAATAPSNPPPSPPARGADVSGRVLRSRAARSSAVSTLSTASVPASRPKRSAGTSVNRPPQRQAAEDSEDTGDDGHGSEAASPALQQSSGQKRKKSQSQQQKPRKAAAPAAASASSTPTPSSSSSVSAMARYFAELDRTPLTALVEVVPVDEVDERSGCAPS